MLKIEAVVCLMALFCSCKTDISDSSGHAASQVRFLVSPLHIDSAYIASKHGAENISYEHIRKSRAKIAEVGDAQLSEVVKDFCAIDSAKRAGGYAQYLEGLDAGMTQDANASTIGSVSLANGAEMELWRLTFSSYDACPVYSGTFVIGNLRHGDKITYIPLGKLFHSADPPATFSEVLTSRIDSSLISITSTTFSDEDVYAGGVDAQTSCFTVRIAQEGMPDESAGEATAQRSP